jgi:hypothetical protein
MIYSFAASTAMQTIKTSPLSITQGYCYGSGKSAGGMGNVERTDAEVAHSAETVSMPR